MRNHWAPPPPLLLLLRSIPSSSRSCSADPRPNYERDWSGLELNRTSTVHLLQDGNIISLQSFVFNSLMMTRWMSVYGNAHAKDHRDPSWSVLFFSSHSLLRSSPSLLEEEVKRTYNNSPQFTYKTCLQSNKSRILFIFLCLCLFKLIPINHGF